MEMMVELVVVLLEVVITVLVLVVELVLVEVVFLVGTHHQASQVLMDNQMILGQEPL